MQTITLIDGTTAPMTEQNAWFLKPALVEGEVVDTATEQELETAAANFMQHYDGRLENLPHYINPEPLYMARLKAIVTELLWRGKGAAIGKRGSKSDIESQIELYENKRLDAESDDPEIIERLTGEAIEYGAASLTDFQNIIISKYEAAHAMHRVIKSIVERGRTKIQTLIEQENYEAARAGFALALSIIDENAEPGDIDPADVAQNAKDILTQILAL